MIKGLCGRSFRLTAENAMTVSANTSTNTQVTPPVATSTDTTKSVDDTKKTQPATTTDAKNQLNANIVQSALAVSLGSQNDPLSLVYKAAIENLNEVLKPELGDNAIQNAAGDDFTPEAVATRILTFVASIYEMYRTQKRDDGASEEHNDTLDRFVGLVSGGIDKGFKEARDILSGLSVLQGDIASNIDKTYALIQEGLAKFVELNRKVKDAAETPDTQDKDTSASDTVKSTNT
jgi:hypothetical protein